MNKIIFIHYSTKKSEEIGTAYSRRVNYINESFPQETEVINLVFSTKENISKKFFWGAKRIKNKNIKYIYLPFLNIKFIRNIFQSIMLFIYLSSKSKKGDLIVTYNFHKYIAIPVLLTKKIKKLKLIIDFEEYYSKMNLKNNSGRYEKKGIRSSSGFISCSETIKKELIKNEKPIAVSSGYTVNTEKIMYESKKIHQILFKQPFLLYSGRLDKYGGVFDLLNIFSELQNDMKLVITGMGNMAEKVKLISKKNSNIIFLGNLSNNKIINLLKNKCICINPMNKYNSYSKYSIPSKVIWWLSMNKIVLSSDCQSLRESKFSRFIEFYDGSKEDFIIKTKRIYEDYQIYQKRIYDKRFMIKKLFENQKKEVENLIEKIMFIN